MNEVPYKLRSIIFYNAKKLELSNFKIVLEIRDQSGSEIYGHTVEYLTFLGFFKSF